MPAEDGSTGSSPIAVLDGPAAEGRAAEGRGSVVVAAVAGPSARARAFAAPAWRWLLSALLLGAGAYGARRVGWYLASIGFYHRAVFIWRDVVFTVLLALAAVAGVVALASFLRARRRARRTSLAAA